MTVVVFRVDTDDDGAPQVVAVFPAVPWTSHPVDMTCYAHVGQHSGCTMDWYRGTSLATPEEYARLLAELEAIGYRLTVRRRITARHHAARIAAMGEGA